jgi:hypothetical protein
MQVYTLAGCTIESRLMPLGDDQAVLAIAARVFIFLDR